MTDRSALIIAALIVIAVLADVTVNQGAGAMFMVRRFADAVEWIAFWR